MDYLLSVTKEDLDNFVASLKVVYLIPGDILYLPSNAVIADKIAGRGFRQMAAWSPKRPTELWPVAPSSKLAPFSSGSCAIRFCPLFVARRHTFKWGSPTQTKRDLDRPSWSHCNYATVRRRRQAAVLHQARTSVSHRSKRPITPGPCRLPLGSRPHTTLPSVLLQVPEPSDGPVREALKVEALNPRTLQGVTAKTTCSTARLVVATVQPCDETLYYVSVFVGAQGRARLRTRLDGHSGALAVSIWQDRLGSIMSKNVDEVAKDMAELEHDEERRNQFLRDALVL